MAMATTTLITLSYLVLFCSFSVACFVVSPSNHARADYSTFSSTPVFFHTDSFIRRQVNQSSRLQANEEDDVIDEDSLSLDAFQQERDRREPTTPNDDDEEEFDGYVMRDIIVEKWGEAFDLEFQRVEAMGFKEIYLNVMPFRLGSKRFRHATEMDYLCHLQAVVEILLKYDQVGHVLYQIDATKKKPRAGTSPLVAVPLRLDLTPEQVDKILGP